MPTLFRFLTVVGLAGGILYGGVYALAYLSDPKPRVITVTIPQDKLMRHR